MNRIAAIDIMRVVAISLVVAGHCFAISGVHVDDYWGRAALSYTAVSSGLFVFIAAFLLYYKHQNHFDYLNYLQKRAVYVLIPYAIFSLVSVLYFHYIERYRLYNHIFDDTKVVDGNIIPIVEMLVNGSAMLPYWFIPMFMLFVVLSPGLLYLSKAPKSVLYPLAVSCLVVSSYVQRSPDNLNPLQSLAFYSPMFMLGLICAKSYSSVSSWASHAKYPLLGFLVAYPLLLAATFPDFAANLHKPFLVYNGFDTLLLHKIALVFTLLGFFKNLRATPKPLLLMADASFAIYLIHPWIVRISYKNNLYEIGLHSWLLYCLACTGVLLLSLLLAYIVKHITGRHSCLLIGW